MRGRAYAFMCQWLPLFLYTGLPRVQLCDATILRTGTSKFHTTNHRKKPSDLVFCCYAHTLVTNKPPLKRVQWVLDFSHERGKWDIAVVALLSGVFFKHQIGCQLPQTGGIPSNSFKLSPTLFTLILSLHFHFAQVLYYVNAKLLNFLFKRRDLCTCGMGFQLKVYCGCWRCFFLMCGACGCSFFAILCAHTK